MSRFKLQLKAGRKIILKIKKKGAGCKFEERFRGKESSGTVNGFLSQSCILWMPLHFHMVKQVLLR
jgi:hypothetical protein